jgi:hypothetical protein
VGEPQRLAFGELIPFSGHIGDTLWKFTKSAQIALADQIRIFAGTTRRRNRTFQAEVDPGPAGFEDRMGHQARAAPDVMLWGQWPTEW